MKDLVISNGSQLTTTSKIVADVFGKVHRNIMRDIDKLECSDEFRSLNFEQSYYITPQNKKLKCYNITKDGFYFLCMGFTGSKAAKWKEEFIKTFNIMEKGLLNVDARINKLTMEGRKIEEAGKEWSAFGHEINRQKKEHLKSVNLLMSDVQLTLGIGE